MSLTLSGDLPGLLRRGSPCVLRVDADAPGYYLDGQACTVHAICEGMASVAVDGVEIVLGAALECLALDLTDATGRAHASWWLAAACYDPEPTACVWHSTLHGWDLSDARGDYVGSWAREALRDEDGVQSSAPMLADLDRDDPRTLPDGSRWVDAEALRRVCLHVAGRPL